MIVFLFIKRNDETAQLLRDEREKLDYFSGLLKSAQTIQEEENERLQELTAFQHFLAAITPKQSLQDLLKCLELKKTSSADKEVRFFSSE